MDRIMPESSAPLDLAQARDRRLIQKTAETPTTEFPGQSCADTKTALIVSLGIIASLLILRWVYEQYEKRDQGSTDEYNKLKAARGKTFLEFVRTGKAFADPDRISVPTFPDEESARVRPLQSGSTNESWKSTWSYVIFPLFCRAGGALNPLFFAIACGLTGCIYTEEGTDSHYDITISKLSKFYDTVDFLPVLFLGFYTTAELARLISLLKTMSSLRANLIDQGVHLAQVAAQERAAEGEESEQDRRQFLYKMYR